LIETINTNLCESFKIKKKLRIPVDSRAELIQAPCVCGGGVVEFRQAVHPLQNHLQHVSDLPQHTTRLHTSQHWVEKHMWKDKREITRKLDSKYRQTQQTACQFATKPAASLANQMVVGFGELSRCEY